MAETACPFCMYSPIARGAEACPRCRRRFVDDIREDSVVTSTRAGGITGAVTASPVPVAVALVLGAVAWLLRVLDVFAALADPPALLVVPVALVAGAASVMAAVGPAKHVPAALGVLCLGAAGLFSTLVPFHDLAFLAYGALLLVATVSEPSGARLKGGAALAGLAALAALVVLAVGGSPTNRQAPAPLLEPVVGLQWTVPAGWRGVERLEQLVAPEASARRGVLRATNGDGVEAFLVVERGAGLETCPALLAELGGAPVKTGVDAPPPFPRGTPVLEVSAASGAVRAACAVTVNGPVLAVVVASTGPAAVLEATLRVLGSGAQFTAAPAAP